MNETRRLMTQCLRTASTGAGSKRTPFAGEFVRHSRYDDLVRTTARRASRPGVRGRAVPPGGRRDPPRALTPADAVTLDCVTEAPPRSWPASTWPRRSTRSLDALLGPALHGAAARAVLLDPAAAQAYLTRLRRSAAWLDQVSERLRARELAGPVPPLVEQCHSWAHGPGGPARSRAGPVPRPPAGWDGRRRGSENAWRWPRTW